MIEPFMVGSYASLGQKSVIQIYDRWSDYKIMKQNVPEGSDF